MMLIFKNIHIPRMTYNIDFDYITNYIRDNCDYLELDEDSYYDIKH